jgi:hypothetical protein
MRRIPKYSKNLLAIRIPPNNSNGFTEDKTKSKTEPGENPVFENKTGSKKITGIINKSWIRRKIKTLLPGKSLINPFSSSILTVTAVDEKEKSIEKSKATGRLKPKTKQQREKNY